MFDELIGMTVLPAADLQRARAFWHEVLGRDPVRSDEGGDLYDVAGSFIFVYETPHAGSAQNTVLGLVTDDLDRDMTELRTRGVVFNDYDLPDLQTVEGVMQMGDERSAWFTDTEGNIIALMQPSPTDRAKLRSLRSEAVAAG